MPGYSRRMRTGAPRPRGQRRKLVWATDIFQNVAVGPGAKLPQRDLLANLEVAGSSVLGATIMSTHATLSFSEPASDTAHGVYAGFIVNSAPTVTNLDPSSPAAFGDDWMLLRVMSPSHANRQVYINGTSLVWGQEIDLRAKRKIEELSEKYWFMFTNGASGTVNTSGFIRTLIALP